MKPDQYDALIIGSGQGGKPLATDLARAGRRTALIERDQVGGSCVNYGCTPTKTMVASARVAYLASRAADYGVRVGKVEVDLSTVRERKRAIVESFRSGSERGIERTDNLELIRGSARFRTAGELEVEHDGGSRRVSAPLTVINTGCRPRVPSVEGLSQVPYLDSTSVMELDRVPDHLMVMGGGYIGLEFGQMFRRFGSRVTIIQRGSQLLAREDPDVAEEVARILRDDGVEVLLDAEVTRASQAGGVRLRVESQGRARQIEGDQLLVATGRVPNSDQLNLDKAGVEADERGFIRVNDRLETTASGVYAIGDVKGGPQFTHISYDDYRILKSRLLDGQDADINNRLVPYTVFIDPQLGRVGLNEEEARRRGVPYKVAKMPMDYVARALEMDESRGFMKAVVNPENHLILGFTCLGVEGGEIMSQVQVAMMAGLPYTRLRDGIFAHPLLAEALNNLFSDFE